jgi:hypothetical protein
MTLKIRVNQPVIEHLSAQCTPDPREGSIVSGVQSKLEPSYWCIWHTLKIIKSRIELRNSLYVDLLLLDFKDDL